MCGKLSQCPLSTGELLGGVENTHQNGYHQKLIDLKYGRLPWTMRVSLTQTVEGLKL